MLVQWAGVAQLAERLLPKQDVVGSSPITRPKKLEPDERNGLFFYGAIQMVAMPPTRRESSEINSTRTFSLRKTPSLSFPSQRMESASLR